MRSSHLGSMVSSSSSQFCSQCGSLHHAALTLVRSCPPILDLLFLPTPIFDQNHLLRVREDSNPRYLCRYAGMKIEDNGHQLSTKTTMSLNSFPEPYVQLSTHTALREPKCCCPLLFLFQRLLVVGINPSCLGCSAYGSGCLRSLEKKILGSLSRTSLIVLAILCITCCLKPQLGFLFSRHWSSY